MRKTKLLKWTFGWKCPQVVSKVLMLVFPAKSFLGMACHNPNIKSGFQDPDNCPEGYFRCNPDGSVSSPSKNLILWPQTKTCHICQTNQHFCLFEILVFSHQGGWIIEQHTCPSGTVFHPGENLLHISIGSAPSWARKEFCLWIQTLGGSGQTVSPSHCYIGFCHKTQYKSKTVTLSRSGVWCGLLSDLQICDWPGDWVDDMCK